MMNYLQVIEILKKMEYDTKMIQLEKTLVRYKRKYIYYKKDATTK